MNNPLGVSPSKGKQGTTRGTRPHDTRPHDLVAQSAE